jgi:hypothetical protein
MALVLSWNLARKHLFPEDWTVTHPNAMYCGALALYFVFELCLGILLGRITKAPVKER